MTDKPELAPRPRLARKPLRRAEWQKIAATVVLAIIPVAVGLIQFGHNYAFSLRQPFLSKQTEMCVAAAENAARLASTRDPDTWRKAREQFWMLYFGPLAIVEDVGDEDTNRVTDTMELFGRKLKKVEGDAPNLPIDGLEDEALAIAHACSDLLVSSWDYGLFGWFGGNARTKQDVASLDEDEIKTFYELIDLKVTKPWTFYDPTGDERVPLATWDPRVGAEAPDADDLPRVPAHHDLESVWRFRFTVVNDRIVLVDPRSRKVVLIVDKLKRQIRSPAK